MTRYFKKEIASNPYYLNNGRRAPFVPQPGNFGILATEDAYLSQELSLAASRRAGGVLELTQDQFIQILVQYASIPNAKVFRAYYAQLPPGALQQTLPTDHPDSGYHSGDLGDIIYALPTFRALGLKVLYLGPDNRSGWDTREPLTKARFAVIAPLLKEQAYISDVRFSETMPDGVVDLNDFRKELSRCALDLAPGFNLARVPLYHWKLPLELDNNAWLTAPNPVTVAKVVFARSSRYHNPAFPWDKVVEKYGKEAVFVGLPAEHADFCRRYGTVRHYPTETFLDLANVIAGALLFVGNQSSPYSIAIGLGSRNILENDPKVSNVIFRRNTVTVGWPQGKPFPDADKGATKRANPSFLVINGIAENFTGYGQMVHQICLHMLKSGISWLMHPFCKSEQFSPIAQPIKERLIAPQTEYDLLVGAVLDVPKLIKGGEVAITMWESTRITPQMVGALNQASCVIVPCQWNEACFSACGVDVPIRVVPLGIDPDVYKYIPPVENESTFRFATAGRFAHAGPRKALEETVDMFLDAFPDNEDAELHVKIFHDCKLPEMRHPRIFYYKDFMSTEDFARWYAKSEMFITASHGEGWGLHAHQSMAVGRPVIAPRFGGMADFLTPENSYCCRYTMTDASWGPYIGCGHWSTVDRDHFIDLLRYAYSNRGRIRAMGKRCAKSVMNLTWANTSDGVVKVLKEFGKL